MLEKADAKPFYFGDGDKSYFWRVALIEDGNEKEIYAERSVGNTERLLEQSYYCISYNDKKARQSMYDDIIIDFVMFNCNSWRTKSRNDALYQLITDSDEGLEEILYIFDKSDSDFITDVLYWYGFALTTEPNSDMFYTICDDNSLSEKERVIKKVIDRSETTASITFQQDDTFYSWYITKCSGRLWYLRRIEHYRENYVYFTDEYGSAPLTDEDSVEAIRDAFLGCASAEGCIVIKTENNPDLQLQSIGLTIEDFA